jgi:hypothetical protein
MRTDAAWGDTEYFVAKIIDAMAVVSTQVGSSENQALVLMNERARVSDLSLEQISLQVLAGEIRFDE